MTVHRFGDWKKAMAIIKGLAPRFRRACDQALMKEGHLLRGKVVEGIASGSPGGKTYKPLSAMTLAVRKLKGFGGSKPMNVTGAFRAAVTVARYGGKGSSGTIVFVGILRQARAKGGKSMANLGEIHEQGRSWSQRLTPKMRRFLFAALRKSPGLAQKGPRLPGGKFSSSSDGMLHITIPARPTFGPVMAMYGKPEDVLKRFWENVAAGMNYDLGRP